MMHDASVTVSQDWQRALDAFVASRMQTPFSWGTNDCVMFAADAIVATGGPDHAQHIRGTYGTALEAERIVRELGGLHSIGRRAGPEKPPRTASVGDVGVVVDDGRELIAVCVGNAWVAPGSVGLSMLPFDAAIAAWSVNRA